jgi:hypothetical protein
MFDGDSRLAALRRYSEKRFGWLLIVKIIPPLPHPEK